MKRLILAAPVGLLALGLAACALTTSASALDLTIRYAPPKLFTPGASARMITVPDPLDAAERAARDTAIARWTDHCQPVKHRDAYGITRLTYAHPGCEFGEGE